MLLWKFQEQLRDVEAIQATALSFAALRKDRSDACQEDCGICLCSRGGTELTFKFWKRQDVREDTRALYVA